MPDFADVPDEQFGLILQHDGQKSRHLPLRNATEVKTAAEYLAANKNEFRLSDRQQIAARILSRADETVADISLDNLEDLRKQAGLGECVSSDAQALLRSRSERLVRRYGAPLLELYKAASVPLSRESRLRLAATIDELDHETGLHRQYGEALQRPEEVLFGLTPHVIKTALEQHVQLTDGAVYEKQALAAVTEPALRDWLGDDVADEVCELGGVNTQKLAASLPTLSRDAATRFNYLAKAVGVARVA